MKKLIIAMLCCIAIPAFAINEDYNSVQECQESINTFELEAINGNNPELFSWFESFRKDDQITLNDRGVNNLVIYTGGCSVITYKDQDDDGRTRWSKMRGKLDRQIQQLKEGKDSVYGNKADYACWVRKGEKLSRDNCN